jgi:hypothetical protein
LVLVLISSCPSFLLDAMKSDFKSHRSYWDTACDSSVKSQR